MPYSVRIAKRLFDTSIALFILLTFLPLWILIAIAIKVDSRGPIFYKQHRAKRCGNFRIRERCFPNEIDEFLLYKFRTMTVDAESESGAVNASENDPRVTRVGRYLRPIRLDEIPNFINVLRGEMSIVGPRADRLEILGQVSRDFPYIWERTRFVKPGITGLAQIELRSNGTLNGNKGFEQVVSKTDKDKEVLSFRYKMYYDFAYQLKLTKFWSFVFTDLGIIIKTPIVMFVRRNTI